MKKESDLELYEMLKNAGYHIPETVIDLKLDAPLESAVVVTCTYYLYKDENPMDKVKGGMIAQAMKNLDEEILFDSKDEEIKALKKVIKAERKARRYLQEDYDNLIKRYYSETI